MRVVIQRVSEASVTVEGRVTGQIRSGLLILAGFESDDNSEDIEWVSGKISRLRIFPDSEGVMNLSLAEADGSLLVVSQFTLHASTKKGNRPSYIRAAPPYKAKELYEKFIAKLHQDTQKDVQTGIFGAMMQVKLINDGPVTIIMDSRNKE
ncbi:MAG: D-tyrosyl-tRNA(Tyr) deacylase [Bacteroidetes bacterium ADurb.Bin408]|nr:MAG: D-tyrosyl-tRNA(Tyr) deacylase [Bacteroidetes bacterium ADurb.Bin408]